MREAAMAPFDSVSTRRVRDDKEDSFLDWEGEATLFREEEEEDELDEERDELEASDDVEEDEDLDEGYDEDDDEVEELDFG